MGPIDWEDKYSVKVMEMDEQHMKLITMINTLFSQMKAGKSNQVLLPMVQEMMLYTREHFTQEEAYMKQYEYPEYDNHVKQHAVFIEKIVDIQRKLEQTPLLSSMQMFRFLNNWLVEHICGVDMKYSYFFNSKGLK